jgi:hypothetical protein
LGCIPLATPIAPRSHKDGNFHPLEDLYDSPVSQECLDSIYSSLKPWLRSGCGALLPETSFGSERALLLLDGHCSRNSPFLWKEFADERVDVLCFPAHVTHLIQPLDMFVNAEFKRVLKENLGKLSQPARKEKGGDFLSAIDDAVYACQRPMIIQGSFEEAGICPFAPSKILRKLPETCPDSLRPYRERPNLPHSLGNKVLTSQEMIQALKEGVVEEEDSEDDEELRAIQEELSWIRGRESCIIKHNEDEISECVSGEKCCQGYPERTEDAQIELEEFREGE